MTPIKVLTTQESDIFLKYATETQMGYRTLMTRKRNRLMILLMLDAGLRVGEVVNLQWGDLQVKMIPVHTLIVRAETTKTGKSRELPLSQRLQRAIRDWMLKTNHLDWTPAEKPVFKIRRTGNPITTRQVQRIMQDLGWKSIHKAVHPHMLRHTFGTNLMRVTDLRTAQTLLGHDSITSTQVYMHPTTSDQQKAIDKLTDAGHSESPQDNPDKS